MIGLTHDEAQTVVLMKEAIGAMNALILHINRRRTGTGLSDITIARIIEADFMLNAAEDDFINDEAEMRLTE